MTRPIYTLHAIPNDGLALKRTLDATDDTDAVFAAIAVVMTQGFADPQGPWARGRIELRRDGEAIHVMEAKA